MRKPLAEELGLYEKLFEPEYPIDIKKGLNAEELVCAPAVKGDAYDGEAKDCRLMYVGRALNSWGAIRGDSAKSLAKAVFEQEDLESFLHDVVHEPQIRNKEGKLLYNFNQSPFWQLCRSLLTQVGKGENWAERIVWSNVYKVSPQEGGVGNWDLLEETFLPCVDILRYELELFKPSHVVFATGSAYFLAKEFGDSFKSMSNVPVMQDPKGAFEILDRGTYTCKSGDEIKIVTTTSMMFKPGSMEEKAEKIIRAFRSLK